MKRIDRKRSDMVMNVLDKLERKGLVSGDVMHVGGSLWVTLKNLGTVKFSASEDGKELYCSETRALELLK